ncbi:MAG: hypothetical protein KDJ16_05445 [Hyphomicrobiales bacterium]|nr:hypothetical protein [Hyphomicrobiales bacterium]
MGKYDSLRDHLRNLAALEWNAGFHEIEKVLGFELPNSATRHRSWWSNSGGVQVHQEAWLKAGWEVAAADIGRRMVTFRRLRQHDAREPAPGQRAGPAPNARKVSAGDAVSLTVRLHWTRCNTPEGGVGTDQLPSVPGLFRLVFADGDDLHIAIGTAFDLRQRIAGYFPVGAKKNGAGKTPRRLAERLAAGNPTAVEFVTEGNAWLLRDGQGRKASFADEIERTFVAEAAVLDARARGFQVLPIDI